MTPKFIQIVASIDQFSDSKTTGIVTEQLLFALDEIGGVWELIGPRIAGGKWVPLIEKRVEE